MIIGNNCYLKNKPTAIKACFLFRTLKLIGANVNINFCRLSCSRYLSFQFGLKLGCISFFATNENKLEPSDVITVGEEMIVLYFTPMFRIFANTLQ